MGVNMRVSRGRRTNQESTTSCCNARDQFQAQLFSFGGAFVYPLTQGQHFCLGEKKQIVCFLFFYIYFCLPTLPLTTFVYVYLLDDLILTGVQRFFYSSVQQMMYWRTLHHCCLLHAIHTQSPFSSKENLVMNLVSCCT